ncbi:MAG TPA: Gfo/Idh/MocA family oxidoreductase [Bacteroidota bacterium]|jgi:predicted dehydrogenase|nr:Gfo/Idh/MocA family oxidoreductase [Bacteroidota bacterium]
MSKLAVGVIGVGHLGSLHAKMFAGIESVDFVGIYDVDSERMRSIAGELKTRTYSSAEELLQTIQAVSIVTPTNTHYEIARKAIERGVHVFIEKPLTGTTEEAEALVRLAKQKNLKIQVGHIERFNPAILALDKYNLQPMFVESHRLAQFNPRGTDVAVVLDLMIHDIDIIMSLVHSPVEQIDANGVAVVSESIDIANARIRFENGCVANVTASRISQKKMRKMRMFQRDAYISVDFLEGSAEVFRLVDEDDLSAKSTMMLGAIEAGTRKRNIVYEQPEVREVNALKIELESFVDAVRGSREPLVTGEDGMRALRVAHDIIEIIKRGKIVIS